MKKSEGLEIDVLITDFGNLAVPEAIKNLKTDRRTKEGKLRAEWEAAISVLHCIAWSMEREISEVIPREFTGRAGK